MATAEYDVIAEAEKALYVASRRGQYNRPLDVAKSHATPHQPKHCGCQACVHGFTHITGVAR